jgi:hypothetical protein
VFEKVFGLDVAEIFDRFANSEFKLTVTVFKSIFVVRTLDFNAISHVISGERENSVSTLCAISLYTRGVHVQITRRTRM